MSELDDVFDRQPPEDFDDDGDGADDDVIHLADFRVPHCFVSSDEQGQHTFTCD